MFPQKGGVDEGLQFTAEGFIPAHGCARHSSSVSRYLATEVAHLTSGISAGLAAYTGLDDELTANQSRRAENRGVVTREDPAAQCRTPACCTRARSKCRAPVPTCGDLLNSSRARLGLDNGCLQTRVHARVSHDDIYHTMLGVMELRNDVNDPQRDLRFAADAPRARPSEPLTDNLDPALSR